jgi:serine/threonine protein kinase
MSLTAGVRLGPYEILAPLGSGGMGEVYKARDTRLDRTVAIKILPAALALDPQFRDPYVVTGDGQRFLVMVPVGAAPADTIQVVTDWPGLLTK